MANGKKTKEKSLGRRFVEWKPLASRYPDDPEKAKLQEDRVADMIDFFVPQSKEEVALEAAFALVPGVSGKMASKGARVVQKKVPEVVEYLRNYISDPEWVHKMDNIIDNWDEAVDLKRDYLKRLDEIEFNKNIQPMDRSQINARKPSGYEGEVHAVFSPNDDKIYINSNTLKDIDEKSAIPLLAEEIMHYVTKGNTNIPSGMKAFIKENQKLTPRRGKSVVSYATKKYDYVPIISKSSTKYAQDPTETYSKIMGTRATGKLRPGETILESDLPKAPIHRPITAHDRLTTKYGMANEGLQDLRHGYSDREIANLMTKLPIVAPNITEKDLKDIEILEP